jgi:hypothetical protein
LPITPDQAAVEIQVAPGQRADFAQAQAGGIEQFQQRAVTAAELTFRLQLDQLHGFVGVEHLRQPAVRGAFSVAAGLTSMRPCLSSQA